MQLALAPSATLFFNFRVFPHFNVWYRFISLFIYSECIPSTSTTFFNYPANHLLVLLLLLSHWFDPLYFILISLHYARLFHCPCLVAARLFDYPFHWRISRRALDPLAAIKLSHRVHFNCDSPRFIGSFYWILTNSNLMPAPTPEPWNSIKSHGKYDLFI